MQQRCYGFPVKHGDMVANGGRFVRYVFRAARGGSGGFDSGGDPDAEDR